MAAVTLYHWEPNANSGKPMLALMEKGVAFDSHYLDLLRFDQHQPGLPGDQPAGHDSGHAARGAACSPSRPPSWNTLTRPFRARALMPAGPVDRWRIRWWMKFLDQWLGPELFDDRLERVRGPGGPRARPGGAQGRDRAHSAARAPRRLAQGDLRAVQRGGAAGVAAPRRARAYACSRQRWPGAPGSPATSTAWPTSTASTWRTPCHWRNPKLSNDELTPNILRWLRAIYARPATRACWALGRTDMVKRVAILERPHIAAGQVA